MTLYKVGFTGTQEGLSVAQTARLFTLLTEIIIKNKEGAEFHHGDCVGADEQAFAIAKPLGFKTVAHPGPREYKRAFTDSDVILAPREYMDRNADIAFVCDEMIATPKEATEQQRSGTWATVRRARRFYKPITVIFP
jgi:hypothetical protein